MIAERNVLLLFLLLSHAPVPSPFLSPFLFLVLSPLGPFVLLPSLPSQRLPPSSWPAWSHSVG